MIYKRYTKVSNHNINTQSAKINIPQKILSEARFQNIHAMNCYAGRPGEIIYTSEPNLALPWLSTYRITIPADDKLSGSITIPKTFDATLEGDRPSVFVWIDTAAGTIRVSANDTE